MANSPSNQPKDLAYFLGIVGRIIGTKLGVTAYPDITRPLEALDQLSPLIEALSDGHAFGFYDGLIEGLTTSRQHDDRFVSGQAEKMAIANYCLTTPVLGSALKNFVASLTEGTVRNPQLRATVFFESGTTISYVAGRLAKFLREETNQGTPRLPMPITVITNNLICITALAKLVESVLPTHGRLEYKYFGFLACEDTVPSDRINLAREHANYSALVESIKNCQSVFATCSRFSFILGPLVGSRANCLTKCAMYQGASGWSRNEGKEFFLCFHFGKIVPFVSALSETELRFESPDNKCQYVFPPETIKAVDRMSWQRNLQNHLKKKSNCDFQLEPNWHLDAMENHGSEKVPLEDVNKHCITHTLNLYGRLSTWRGWIQNNPTCHLLIALPPMSINEAIAHLKEELALANHYFELKRSDVRYTMVAEPSAGMAKISFESSVV